MSAPDSSIIIATRGSALALAQANMILAQCRSLFPQHHCQLKIIKTTGDKMQTMALANPNAPVAKGLFTKELEAALLEGAADLAVHSLKDLPTDLPDGLELGAVTERADVRDVLIYRDAEGGDWADATAVAAGGSGPARVRVKRALKRGSSLMDFPSGATIATSSTRRQAQLLALRPDLKLVPIRGNVGTRLRKLAEQPELDGLVLAAAGLHRLQFTIDASGVLGGTGVPAGLVAVYFPAESMLPCVGQGAIGIETRSRDDRMAALCQQLNHAPTMACVTAERAFLHAMGGGCLSPVAAYADIHENRLRLRAVSFRDEKVRRGQLSAPLERAAQLGSEMAVQLRF